MAISKKTNLSELENVSAIPKARGLSIGIVVSEWNWEVCGNLLKGCLNLLNQNKVKNITEIRVPGSYELVQGALMLLDSGKKFDAVICLGCVIQGETRHFDFICDAVANGIMKLQIDRKIPIIFGVLTPNNMKQALDRCGGKHGNKGDEAAATAIKMAVLKKNLKK